MWFYCNFHQVAKMVLSEEIGYGEAGPGGSIVLNSTAEFCRTLGDIPTYGLAGNRDEDAQEMLVSRFYRILHKD